MHAPCLGVFEDGAREKPLGRARDDDSAHVAKLRGAPRPRPEPLQIASAVPRCHRQRVAPWSELVRGLLIASLLGCAPSATTPKAAPAASPASSPPPHHPRQPPPPPNPPPPSPPPLPAPRTEGPRPPTSGPW